MTLRQTHTYVVMNVTRGTYDEVARKMRDAGYDHVFGEDGEIDMHGVALGAETDNAGCECKERVNKKLAETNTQLDYNLMCETDVFVSTIKLDEKKRGRPTRMLATYCPFCGTRLKKELEK